MQGRFLNVELLQAQFIAQCKAFDVETHKFSKVCTSPAFVESKSVALGKWHCMLSSLAMLLYHGVFAMRCKAIVMENERN